MYELASKLDIEESSARLYEKFYRKRIEDSVLKSKIQEKIKDLKENNRRYSK